MLQPSERRLFPANHKTGPGARSTLGYLTSITPLHSSRLPALGPSPPINGLRGRANRPTGNPQPKALGWGFVSRFLKGGGGRNTFFWLGPSCRNCLTPTPPPPHAKDAGKEREGGGGREEESPRGLPAVQECPCDLGERSFTSEAKPGPSQTSPGFRENCRPHISFIV